MSARAVFSIEQGQEGFNLFMKGAGAPGRAYGFYFLGGDDSNLKAYDQIVEACRDAADYNANNVAFSISGHDSLNPLAVTLDIEDGIRGFRVNDIDGISPFHSLEGASPSTEMRNVCNILADYGYDSLSFDTSLV